MRRRGVVAEVSEAQPEFPSTTEGVEGPIKRLPPGFECGENAMGDNEAGDVDLAVSTRGGDIPRMREAVPDPVESSLRRWDPVEILALPWRLVPLPLLSVLSCVSTFARFGSVKFEVSSCIAVRAVSISYWIAYLFSDWHS